jgi:hypothetical protein
MNDALVAGGLLSGADTIQRESVEMRPRHEAADDSGDGFTENEVAATKTMIKRTDERLGLKPNRLTADTAYGTGKFLNWLIDSGITPHIPVWDMS